MTIHYDLCNNIYSIICTRQAHFCCLRRFCYNNMYHNTASAVPLQYGTLKPDAEYYKIYNVHCAPV